MMPAEATTSPTGEIGEMGRNRGGAHVDGEAEYPVMEAGPDRHQFLAAAGNARVHRAGDFPFAFFQRRLKLRDYREIAGEITHLPLLGQGAVDALKVGGGLVHVGLLDLDVVKPRGRIHFDVAHLGGLAHHLLVHLGFGRHVDDDVGEQLRLAGKPAARGQPAQFVVALLDLGEGREMINCGGDAMLGEFAFAHIDLAAPANGPAAANRIDINAQRTRRRKHRRAKRKPPALAGGRKYDEGVGPFSHLFNFLTLRSPRAERAGLEGPEHAAKPVAMLRGSLGSSPGSHLSMRGCT